MSTWTKFPDILKRMKDYYFVAFKDKVMVFDEANESAKTDAIAIEVLSAITDDPEGKILIVSPKKYHNTLNDKFDNMGLYDVKLDNGGRITRHNVDFCTTGATELNQRQNEKFNLVILDRIRWIRGNNEDDLEALKYIHGKRVLVVLEENALDSLVNNYNAFQMDYNCLSLALCMAGLKWEGEGCMIPWYEYKAYKFEIERARTALRLKDEDEAAAEIVKNIKKTSGNVNSYCDTLDRSIEKMKICFSRFIYSLGKDLYGNVNDENLRRNIENCNASMSLFASEECRADDIDAEKVANTMNEWKKIARREN